MRQKFSGIAIVRERIGTIVAPSKYRGDWLVKWDDDPSPKPRLVPVYERSLEPEIDPGGPV